LRYSFKALLVLFTLAAMCIGISAVRWHSARGQRDVVAALRAVDATIWYKYETWDGEPRINVPDPLADSRWMSPVDIPAWKIWLGRKLGRDFVFDVSHVYKGGQPLAGELVARLPDLRGLDHLQLNVGEGFDDDAWHALLRCRQIRRLTLERAHREPTRRLAGLASLGQLEVLEISFGDFTAEDAQEVARLPQLRELTLTMVGTTDDALQSLALLKNLESLQLVHRGFGREVTIAGVEFVTQLPKIRSLTLARLPKLDDRLFSHLKLVRGLKSLNVDQATITGSELRQLASLPKLLELNLIGTRVDDEAMEKLAALTLLESLDISGTRVSDAGLMHLGSLKNLRKLNISRNALTDVGAAEISRLTQLEELLIGDNAMSDASLTQFANLSKLRSLWLGGNSRITHQGVAELKVALPECNVYQH
jgi:hypothetical protein